MFRTLLLALSVSLLTACQTSSRDEDESFVDISRPIHYFRHSVWSGIFPFGGRIPDPHYLYSQVYEDLGPIAKKIGARKVRYQFFDINPFFENATSEYVLALEVDGKVTEVPLNLSGSEGVRVILGRGDDAVALLPAKDRIILLVTYSKTGVPGERTWNSIAAIPLPIQKHKMPLEVFSPEDERYKNLVREIPKEIASIYKKWFCNSTNSKRKFFEEQFESCTQKK